METFERRHFWVIEDNRLDALILQRFLDRTNKMKAFRWFRDAETAVEKMRKLSVDACPDAILLDLNLPGMNGFEFLESFEDLALERLGHWIPVVIVSSSCDVGDQSKAFSYASVKDYVIKPVTKTAALRMVQLSVDLKELQPAYYQAL